MNVHSNKSKRLKNWNYRDRGVYFVTFCTHGRATLLGSVHIEGDAALPMTTMNLSAIGECCVNARNLLLRKNPSLHIDHYVIMPNHVHALIDTSYMSDNANPGLAAIVGNWKRIATSLSRQTGFKGTLWQRSFHDHIVRNEKDMERILEYIETNPAKWALDRYYCE